MRAVAAKRLSGLPADNLAFSIGNAIALLNGAMPSEQEQQPSTAAPASSRSKLWLWVAIVAVIIGAAAGGLAFARGRRHPTTTTPEQPAVHAVLHLEPFVVNLSGGGYLRIGIDLGIAGEEEKNKPPSEPVQRIAVVRDLIVAVLTQNSADDLLSSEGKQKLKSAVLARLEQEMPQLHAREVYFTEFLVQP